MIIQITAQNIKENFKKEVISVEGNTVKDMINAAYENGYEINKLNLVDKILKKNNISVKDDANVVFDNSQFVYFANINEVLNVLKKIFKENPQIDADSLCNKLDKYDRQYQQ